MSYKRIEKTKKVNKNKTDKKNYGMHLIMKISKEPKSILVYKNQKQTKRRNVNYVKYVDVFKEKFLICSNETCGIIYKDTLDETAEWRYYGADDSSSVDPTRCGMPINPLLKQSSYGCKVLCNNRMTYEMRK